MSAPRVDRMSVEDISYYRSDTIRWVRIDRMGREVRGTAASTEVGGIVAAQHPEGTVVEVKTRTIAKVVNLRGAK